MCFYLLLSFSWGGAHPKKTKKKPVATPKSANWHWFFFGFFWFFKISKLALVFFLVFFGFFGFFLALILARIRNWKLVFFWFFLGFLVFFWFFLA